VSIQKVSKQERKAGKRGEALDASSPRVQRTRQASGRGLARYAPTALAGLVSAGAFLATPAASAQMIYQSGPAVHAQQALQAFLGGTTGPINGGENPPRDLNTNGTMMWHDANTVEMLFDYFDATQDTTFLPIAESYKGYDPSYPFTYATGTPFQFSQFNSYNDDTLWWALAFIRAYDSRGDSWYLQAAENVFERACTQWTTASCGGGVPWREPGNGTDSTYLNAITNELFLQTATKLALRDPAHANVCSAAQSFPNTYEGWAWADYEWFSQHYLYAGAKLPIPDGIQPANGNCVPAGTAWTYNQGPVLGALLDLANIADNDPAPPATAADLAQRGIDIANAVMSPVSSGGLTANGILTEPSDVGGSQNGCLNDSNGNCPEFKGILTRYLGRFVDGLGPFQGFMPYSLTPFLTSAGAYLEQNANAIWANSVSPGMLTENWSVQQSYGSYPSQPTETSGLDGLIAAIWLPTIAPPPPGPPPAPQCQFWATTTGTAASGTISVNCTADSANDPIFIYDTVNGYTFLYDYYSPQTNGSAPIMSGVASGTTVSFTACTENGTLWLHPGETGCTTVAIPVTMPAACVPATAAACWPGGAEGNYYYPSQCGQTLSDGCGGTFTCPACPVCTPTTTCASLGAVCATTDNCGNPLDCGTCGGGDVCSAGHCCSTGDVWSLASSSCVAAPKPPPVIKPPPIKCNGKCI
jgi:hypothetical protein